jgi:branched-chain amino acid transport system substrate-binding protein
VIGASLSLTGDFSADGQAFQKGYELWASDVNAQGGLLGRHVTLKILNDNSSPTQVQTNYQTLFSSDKVDLAFGPFSSLLTTPSASVAARYGYALVEGAGGAPSVFASPANQSAHNVFDVSLPIVDELGRPTGILTVQGIMHYLVEHFPAAIYNLPPVPHHSFQQREGA